MLATGIIRGSRLILLLFMALTSLSAGQSATQDASTTGTLTIGSLFQAGATSSQEGQWAYLFEPPDLTRWRAVTPTPAPPDNPVELTPAMEVADISTVRPLYLVPPAEETPVNRFYFARERRRVDGSGPGEAGILLRTDFRRLRVRYDLRSEDGATHLVLLHGPSVEESFRVPPGRYTLRRTIWRPEDPGRRLTEIFIMQALAGGFDYDAVADAADGDRMEGALERLRAP